MIGQSKILMTMFNSVLDVSRLESGSLPLDLSRGDLRTIAREALDSLGLLLERHAVGFDAPETPVVVECDADLVRRVIVNLLTNALQFTPAGEEIAVEVSRNGGMAAVAVRDNGPPIPAEYHTRIFEKFGQAGVKEQKKMHSLGLGLTFCRLAVQAHGGEIGLESAEEAGTTFRFTLPTA